MLRTFSRITLVTLSAAGLSACGGSSGGAGSYETLAATANTALPVAVVSQDSGSLAGSIDTAALFDGSTDSVTAGATTFGLNTTSILTTGMDYIGAIDGANNAKFVAIGTATSDMPSATATYNGQAVFVLPIAGNTPQDGIYTGQMSVDITTDFANDTQLTLTNVTGGQLTTTSNPTGSSYTATGSESIAFGDLAISGNMFTADNSSTIVVSGFGSGNATHDVSGASTNVAAIFAGPDAAEVAGTASVTGSSVGGMSVIFVGGQ